MTLPLAHAPPLPSAALGGVRAPPGAHRERSLAPHYARNTPLPLFLPAVALASLDENARLCAPRGLDVGRGQSGASAAPSACPWATGIKNVRARSSAPPPVDRTGARSTVGMPHDPVSFHHAWLSAGGLKLGSLSSPWCRPWWPAGTRSTPAHRHAVGTSLRPPATFGSTASASSCSASSGMPHGALPRFCISSTRR